MGLLDRWRGHRANRDLPQWPRAQGPSRAVGSLLTGTATAQGVALVPDVDGVTVGPVLHLARVGPRLTRPGELAAAVATSMRRVGEVVWLRAGELEHRDSLGHRGVFAAPGLRLVSAGGGLISEIGPSRSLRRDGGRFETVTLRWAQGEAATPTVRLLDHPPTHRQGRATVVPLVGEGAAAAPTGPVSVWHVTVPAGSGVDLAVAADHGAVVGVLGGEALLGPELVPVTAGSSAAMARPGTRLSVATRLDGEDVTLVVVTAAPTRADWIAQDLMVAADEADLAAAQEARDSGAFGRLPRLDG